MEIDNLIEHRRNDFIRASVMSDEFIDFVKKNKEPYELIKNADKYNADNRKITILYFSDVKWYTDFKEIQWIEHFIKKVQSVFIRIGEELDDNEEIVYNEGYDLLGYCFLTRMVDISGDRQIEEDELL